MPNEAEQNSAALRELARTNFFVFAYRAFHELNGYFLEDNWHVDALCHALTGMITGDANRLVICIPPRCLKTWLGNVALTAWLLGRNPRAKIISASYAASLAESINMDALKLMSSSWYRSVFPETIINPKRQSRAEFETTLGGYRIATSVGGALTGRGGDVIIVDDALKADDGYSDTMREASIEWFNNTVQSRLNNPSKGSILVIGQRLHAWDLPGKLIEDGWPSLILPMEFREERKVPLMNGKLKSIAAGDLLHSGRHGPKELAGLKKDMGERFYEAQYNQLPEPPGGALFRREWIERYDCAPPRSYFERIFQSWDTAYGNTDAHDFSVCTTWGLRDHKLWLLEVYRARLEFPELEQQTLAKFYKWKPEMVIVEGIGSGKSLYQNIRHAGHLWIKNLNPEGSKEDRASQHTPKFERREIYFPKFAPWLYEFEKEFFAFPGARFDDQVDSVTQFLTAADKLSLQKNGGGVIVNVY